MNNLANIYDKIGRDAEALQIREELLKIHKEVSGPQHPQTLTSMLNLARSYRETGRLQDALKLHEETLAQRRAKLGDAHPEALVSLGYVAVSLFDVGRGPEAVAKLDECVAKKAGQSTHHWLVIWLMEYRLGYFEKLNDLAGCRQTLEIWEKVARRDASSLFLSARIHATLAALLRDDPSAAAEAAAEADLAVALLKESLGSGFKDFEKLKEAPGLLQLRSRPDFPSLPIDPSTQPAKT
jgi:tetratricopeptide (TPR) repeat protein